MWHGLRPRRGHRLEGAGRARARLLARLVGPGDQDVHRDGRPAGAVEDEPTLFEIWVCADGYWCDHTKNLCPGELARASTTSCSSSCSPSTSEARRLLPPGREPRRARPAASATGIAEAGYPGQPTHPICHGVGARAHEPPYAHQAGGGDDRGGHGARDRAGHLLGGRWRPPRRGQLPRHRRRRPRSSRRFPDGVVLLTAPDLDRRAERRATGSAARSGSTTRRCATASRRSASCSTRSRSSRSRARSTSSGSTGSRPASRASRRTTGDAVELIADAGLRAEIWGFSRAVPADVEALVELGVRASVIESPISDAKLAALGVSRETMLERIRDAVRVRRRARHHASPSSASTATRADLDVLRAGLRDGASRPGAKEVVVVDTIGIATPEAVADLVGPDASTGSGRRSRCTSTATTTSGSRPPPRSPPSAPVRTGCTARSTAWASAPATRTSARSR